jgi:hypothetical protein
LNGKRRLSTKNAKYEKTVVISLPGRELSDAASGLPTAQRTLRKPRNQRGPTTKVKKCTKFRIMIFHRFASSFENAVPLKRNDWQTRHPRML